MASTNSLVNVTKMTSPRGGAKENRNMPASSSSIYKVPDKKTKHSSRNSGRQSVLGKISPHKVILVQEADEKKQLRRM